MSHLDLALVLFGLPAAFACVWLVVRLQARRKRITPPPKPQVSPRANPPPADPDEDEGGK